MKMKTMLSAAGAAALALVLTVKPAAAQSKGDAKKGQEVFEQCSVCHNVDSDEKKMGPSLKGLFKHATLKNGKKVTEDNVKDFVNKGGNGMPGYEDMLNAEEKANLIAYLKTV